MPSPPRAGLFANGGAFTPRNATSIGVSLVEASHVDESVVALLMEWSFIEIFVDDSSVG